MTVQSQQLNFDLRCQMNMATKLWSMLPLHIVIAAPAYLISSVRWCKPSTSIEAAMYTHAMTALLRMYKYQNDCLFRNVD